MKIVAICPIKNPDIYQSHADVTCKRDNIVVVNVHDDKPPYEPVAKKFLMGIEFAMTNNMLQRDDVVLFMHEDVLVLDGFLKQKLEMVFTDKPTVGMIGVEGVKELTSVYPEKFTHGHFVQGNSMDGVGKGSHVVNGGSIGFYPNMAAVNNYLFAVRASLILDGVRPHKLDDKNLYAIDVGLQVQTKGYDLAVIDLFAYHGSYRMQNSNEVAQASELYSAMVGFYESNGVKFPVVGGANIREQNDIVKIEL